MSIQKNVLTISCFVFLIAGCTRLEIDLEDRPCNNNECLKGYECDFADNICKSCADADRITCAPGLGVRVCDEFGAWSECQLDGDGSPVDGGGTDDGDSFVDGGTDGGDSFYDDGTPPDGGDPFSGDDSLPDGGDFTEPSDADAGDTDPCTPDPCNGNGTCLGGICTCTGEWFGESCELEVVLTQTDFISLREGVNTVYKFNLTSVNDVVIPRMYLTFAFRNQSGGPTSISVASVWFYQELSTIHTESTALPTNTYLDMTMDTPATLSTGVSKEYTLVIQVNGYVAGDTLETALTLVELQDGTEITVTGKEFTLP